MTEPPDSYLDVESCVEATISRVGRRIRLGTPLGLGKANHLVNEFFRRAREDPDSARVYLERLGLAAPRTLKERLLQRTVLYALASVDAI